MSDLDTETQSEIMNGIMMDANKILDKARNMWNMLEQAGQKPDHKDIELLLYAQKQLEQKIKFLGDYHY